MGNPKLAIIKTKKSNEEYPITKELFQLALNVTEPWFVSDLKFDVESKRLDVFIDFKKGSIFEYVDTDTNETIKDLKAYDTKDKTWGHLNFFEHECYLHAKSSKSKTT